MALPHLVVDLSGHGFGHLAQTAPVLERLLRTAPPFRITLRTALPEKILRRRLKFDARYHRRLDVGLVMRDAISVDLEASRRWYLDFHRHYPQRLKGEEDRLKGLKPDLLLSNVPYLSIEAASRLGIPAIALCSLHWGEILRAYFGQDRELLAISERIDEAYRRAECFLQPEPSIPMPTLNNTRPIGPTAQIGASRRQEIKRRLGVPDGAKLVLVALGGVPTTFDFEKWPKLDGLFWLTPPEIKTSRPDARNFAVLDLPFQDLIASSDLVITKIGYGTLVESVMAGRPILCALRPIWPETEALATWCRRHGVFEAVEAERLWRGDFLDPLLRLLDSAPKPPAIQPSGVEEAASLLRSKLLASL